MPTIKIPEQFGVEKSFHFSTENIEGFLSQMDRISGPEDVVLDAQNLKWIEPIGYVLLRSLIDVCREKSVKVRWNKPRNSDVQDFLTQMHFFETTSSTEFHSKYCSLVRVEPSNMDPILFQIKAILKTQMNLDDKMLKLFDYSTSELLENIFHHSEKRHGYLSAMTFEKKRKLQIAIVDNGIGVRKSLMKNTDLRDKINNDNAALALAIQPKITSNPISHPIHSHGNAGQGLFFAVEFIKENHGHFYFHSGRGQYVLEPSQTIEKTNGSWDGTIVCLQFNLDYPINIKDVFDKYAPPDKDFEFLGF